MIRRAVFGAALLVLLALQPAVAAAAGTYSGVALRGASDASKGGLQKEVALDESDSGKRRRCFLCQASVSRVQRGSAIKCKAGSKREAECRAVVGAVLAPAAKVADRLRDGCLAYNNISGWELAQPCPARQLCGSLKVGGKPICPLPATPPPSVSEEAAPSSEAADAAWAAQQAREKQAAKEKKDAEQAARQQAAAAAAQAAAEAAAKQKAAAEAARAKAEEEAQRQQLLLQQQQQQQAMRVGRQRMAAAGSSQQSLAASSDDDPIDFGFHQLTGGDDSWSPPGGVEDFVASSIPRDGPMPVGLLLQLQQAGDAPAGVRQPTAAGRWLYPAHPGMPLQSPLTTPLQQPVMEQPLLRPGQAMQPPVSPVVPPSSSSAGVPPPPPPGVLAPSSVTNIHLTVQSGDHPVVVAPRVVAAGDAAAQGKTVKKKVTTTTTTAAAAGLAAVMAVQESGHTDLPPPLPQLPPADEDGDGIAD